MEVKTDAVKNNRNQNVGSMNQGELEVDKQEMASVSINILEISELK